MLLGTRKTLYDHIVEALLEKSCSVAEIQSYLERKKVPATVQGVYKTLRELIAEDIVTKQKKIYLVSNVWRGKLGSLIAHKDPFKLSSGEQATYRFRQLDHLDAFWKHTLADLEEEEKSIPVFHFTPHQFWSYVPGRRESEREYYENLGKQDTNVYTVIGGTSSLDRIAQKFLRTDYHQVYMDPSMGISRRDHVTVMGPYIVITRISGKLAQQVDRAYEQVSDEASLEKELGRLFEKPGSIILDIEHNEAKAKKLRKKLAKDFVVPRELVQKFDLY